MVKTNLIVVSQIKNIAKVEDKPLNVSSDFYEALNAKVKEIIETSCKRAKLNGRNTVMGKDV
jgi:histone H3/H4